MTADDSDPDDRRDESADDHGNGDPADAERDSTDVPIDESSSSDDADDGRSTADADPSGDRRAGGRNEEDRRTGDRDADGSRVGNPSGSDAGNSGADDREAGGSNGNWLSSLLSALESLDSGSTSGRRRTDRTVVDYDISVRSGDDFVDESRRDRRSISGNGPDRDRRGNADSSRSRTRRRRPSSSNAHHLTTRETDEELLVTADVAGAEPEGVTVGFDDSTLVVAVDGSELDRIDVPWRDRRAEATIKNGVLTVVIEPGEREDGPDEETDDSRPDSNAGGGE